MLPVSVRYFEFDAHNVKVPVYSKDTFYNPITVDKKTWLPYFQIKFESVMAVEYMLLHLKCSLCKDSHVIMKPLTYRMSPDRKFQTSQEYIQTGNVSDVL